MRVSSLVATAPACGGRLRGQGGVESGVVDAALIQATMPSRRRVGSPAAVIGRTPSATERSCSHVSTRLVARAVKADRVVFLGRHGPLQTSPVHPDAKTCGNRVDTLRHGEVGLCRPELIDQSLLDTYRERAPAPAVDTSVLTHPMSTDWGISTDSRPTMLTHPIVDQLHALGLHGMAKASRRSAPIPRLTHSAMPNGSA